MLYFNDPSNSHANFLLGIKMNVKFNIWLSVCVVLTSTQGNHFQ